MHSRGSPTKGSRIRSVPQQRRTKSEVVASRGPKRGRKCYITPAFLGIPNIGEQNQKWLPHPYLLGGPKEGGSATATLRSRGSPTEGDGNKSGPQNGGSATSPLRSRDQSGQGVKVKGAFFHWPGEAGWSFRTNNFFLLRTALKDPHYGIFSSSPAQATFELLFGDPRECRGYVALPPT